MQGFSRVDLPPVKTESTDGARPRNWKWRRQLGLGQASRGDAALQKSYFLLDEGDLRDKDRGFR